MVCRRTILWHAAGLTTCIVGLIAIAAAVALLSLKEPAWARGLALGLLVIGAVLGVSFAFYSCQVVRHEWPLFGCCTLPLRMKAVQTPWGTWGRQHDLETATPTPEASVGEDDGAWSSRGGSELDSRTAYGEDGVDNGGGDYSSDATYHEVH